MCFDKPEQAGLVCGVGYRGNGARFKVEPETKMPGLTPKLVS